MNFWFSFSFFPFLLWIPPTLLLKPPNPLRYTRYHLWNRWRKTKHHNTKINNKELPVNLWRWNSFTIHRSPVFYCTIKCMAMEFIRFSFGYMHNKWLSCRLCIYIQLHFNGLTIFMRWKIDFGNFSFTSISDIFLRLFFLLFLSVFFSFHNNLFDIVFF